MDKFDEGFWYGRLHGQASPAEADAYLRRMHGIGVTLTSSDIDLFCNGSEDGARGDHWRLARVANCDDGAG